MHQKIKLTWWYLNVSWFLCLSIIEHFHPLTVVMDSCLSILTIHQVEGPPKALRAKARAGISCFETFFPVLDKIKLLFNPCCFRKKKIDPFSFKSKYWIHVFIFTCNLALIPLFFHDNLTVFSLNVLYFLSSYLIKLVPNNTKNFKRTSRIIF